MEHWLQYSVLMSPARHIHTQQCKHRRDISTQTHLSSYPSPLNAVSKVHSTCLHSVQQEKLRRQRLTRSLLQKEKEENTIPGPVMPGTEKEGGKHYSWPYDEGYRKGKEENTSWWYNDGGYRERKERRTRLFPDSVGM